MKLTAARTQDELQRIVDKELLRRLLADSPLNLPRVFLYALSFIFMPGGILGPMLGAVSTAVMAAIAAWLWLWGEPQALDSFLWFWLIWAMVDLVLLLLIRLVVGICQYRQGKVHLPAEETTAEVQLQPGGRLVLDLAKEEESNPHVVVQVAGQGIYVLTLKVEDEDADVDLLVEGSPCLEEQERVPGLVHVCRAAYRLAPGRHTLSFHVQSRTASRLVVSLR